MLEDMPPHVLRTVLMCRSRWEAEAERRGYDSGYEAAQKEILGGMRVLQHLRPDLSTVNPVDTSGPVTEDDDDVSAELSSVPGDLEKALDDLFGDDRWSDLDRQELVRFVMAAVQESLAARGRDPAPVLDLLARMGGGHKGGGDGFEAAMGGDGEFGQWLSWQAVPLRNPRGDHRFKAVDGESGNELYGHKADAVMRRKNRDAVYEFDEGGDHPPLPTDRPGPLPIGDHTAAYRKARGEVDALRERLKGGGPVRPGDLADFSSHLSLMRADDLRGLRKHLLGSLTKRIGAGRTKLERAANIRDALGRLKAAARAISTVVLKAAEEAGYDISPAEEGAVEEEVGQDILLAGEFGPDDFADVAPERVDGEVTMDDMPTTNAASQPAPPTVGEPMPSVTMSAGPKAGPYSRDVPATPPSRTLAPDPAANKAVPPKAVESAKPVAKPPAPSFSKSPQPQMGGTPQPMAGQLGPGTMSGAESRAKAAEAGTRPQAGNLFLGPDVPRKDEAAGGSAGITNAPRPLDKPPVPPARYPDLHKTDGVRRNDGETARLFGDITGNAGVIDEYRVGGANPPLGQAGRQANPPGWDTIDVAGGDDQQAHNAAAMRAQRERRQADHAAVLPPVPEWLLQESGRGPGDYRPGDKDHERAGWIRDNLPTDPARRAMAAETLRRNSYLFGDEDQRAAFERAVGGVAHHGGEVTDPHAASAAAMHRDLLAADPAMATQASLMGEAVGLHGPVYPTEAAATAMDRAHYAHHPDNNRAESGHATALATQFAEPPGAEAWRANGNVQGILNHWKETRDPRLLPILADAYEEAGAPADYLRLLRENPEAVRPGMWFTRGQAPVPRPQAGA